MLKEKQKKFVSEYIVSLNATDAYRKVYDPYNKKSQRSLESLACQLMSNIEVQQEVQTRTQKINDKIELKAERILREIFRIATSNIQDAFDENGKLIHIKKIPEDIARCISAIEFKNGQVHKLKLWDKSKNLEMLGKHLNLFLEQDRDKENLDNITVNITLPSNGREVKEEEEQ